MKTIKYILAISLLIVCNGCNDSFMDRYPLDAPTDPTYWQTEDHLRLASNACINYLRDKERTVDMELMGDNVYRERTSGYGTIGSGQHTVDHSTLNTEWTTDYDGIRRANHFFENYDRAQVSDSIKKMYLGEARFMRAYNYVSLVNFFGDVPLITKTLDVNDPELYGPREDKEKVIDWVIQELMQAGEELRWARQLSATEFGRPTKEAAWGICSRFALYHERWDEAIAAAEKVFASGYHKLYTEGGRDVAYYNMFTYAGRASRNIANKEVILARIYSNDAKKTHNLSREMQVPNEETRFAPTSSLIDAYLCNGLPINIADSKYDESTFDKQLENRDPRLRQTILFRLDKWGGNPNNEVYYRHKFKVDASWCRTPTGWYFKKYVEIPVVKNYNKDENDIVLLRLAEVYLNWIEAKKMRGDNITQADIDNSINKLRDRVGAPKMELSVLAAHGIDLLDEIRRERRVELALEGERYFDILRWKQGDLLAQDVTGVKKSNVHGEEKEYAAHYKTNATGNIIVQEGRVFTDPKHYLWPVPFRQSAQNPQLLPNNEGWN